MGFGLSAPFLVPHVVVGSRHALVVPRFLLVFCLCAWRVTVVLWCCSGPRLCCPWRLLGTGVVRLIGWGRPRGRSWVGEGWGCRCRVPLAAPAGLGVPLSSRGWWCPEVSQVSAGGRCFRWVLHVLSAARCCFPGVVRQCGFSWPSFSGVSLCVRPGPDVLESRFPLLLESSLNFGCLCRWC